MSSQVVFFFPSFPSTEATGPLGIPAVSTPLPGTGYAAERIDWGGPPKFKKRVLDERKDASLLERVEQTRKFGWRAGRFAKETIWPRFC